MMSKLITRENKCKSNNKGKRLNKVKLRKKDRGRPLNNVPKRKKMLKMIRKFQEHTIQPNMLISK